MKRAKRSADRSGAKLSEWEGEFLGSVERRVEQYGRAFRDPEKGELSAALSIRQAVKLREIGAKANGKAKSAQGLRCHAIRTADLSKKS